MFQKIAVAIAVVLIAGGILAEMTSVKMVEHRRLARRKIDSSSVTAECISSFLSDSDPAVRRYALFMLHEKDVDKGRAAAKKMSSDSDDAVKALAKELLRNRNGALRASMEIPLSQNPLNDHEVFRVKSISTEGESFVMPAKMECDAVEIWFGKVTEHLMVWVNDVLVGDFDPAREDARDMRCDVTKVVRWGCENKMWVTNENGKDRWKKFSVEVLKCGK